MISRIAETILACMVQHLIHENSNAMTKQDSFKLQGG